MQLPRLALSVRQPWAWAIFHGKPVENRDWRRPNPGLNFRGEVCLHAAQGMTRDEYESAAELIESIISSPCPAPADLRRGGIIGVVRVVDVVKDHPSRFFFGPRALVLADQREIDFIPAAGQLGFFEWKRDDSNIVEPAKWMRQWGAVAGRPAPDPQGALF